MTLVLLAAGRLTLALWLYGHDEGSRQAAVGAARLLSALARQHITLCAGIGFFGAAPSITA